MQMAEEEVIRGFGTFYDSTCASAAGDWGGVNCCRTCIWHNTSVAQFASDDLPACPPCVRQYYEAAFRLANASLNVVPLIAYLNPEKCPFGANGWLYNPANDRCYYKSSGRRGISSGFDNAVMRCNVSQLHCRLLPGVMLTCVASCHCGRARVTRSGHTCMAQSSVAANYFVLRIVEQIGVFGGVGHMSQDRFLARLSCMDPIGCQCSTQWSFAYLLLPLPRSTATSLSSVQLHIALFRHST